MSTLIKSLNVLVIDDDRIIRDLNSITLTRAGHHPITKESTEEALEFLANAEYVDLIITDNNLGPGKMRGTEFAALLAEKFRKHEMPRKIPVILSSGDKIALSDNYVFMPKPMSAKTVIATIDAIFAQKPEA